MVFLPLEVHAELAVQLLTSPPVPGLRDGAQASRKVAAAGLADSAGLLRQQALSYATHLATRAEESRDKDLKALAAAEDMRAFALPKGDAKV